MMIISIAVTWAVIGVAVVTLRNVQNQLRSARLLHKQMEEDHALLVHEILAARRRYDIDE
jgi:hypothetical protein